MNKLIHIVTSLLTYQAGCWLLQSYESGTGGWFHFAATIGIGMVIMAQISVLIDDFLNNES